MSKKKAQTLEALQKEHAALYQEFLPTLTRYQEMASRALELQIEIFKKRLQEACPEAVLLEENLVTSISARETPQHLEKLIAKLAEERIKIREIIYDPRTFAFHLYTFHTAQ